MASASETKAEARAILKSGEIKDIAGFNWLFDQLRLYARKDSEAARLCADLDALRKKLDIADHPGLLAKEVKEMKYSCQACGNVWFLSNADAMNLAADAMSNVGMTMVGLGGCLPALFWPKKKLPEIDRCQKCGSRAVSQEAVIHKV